MSDTRDVISAFLDDEPFDPDELTEALGDPSGRALLIDLIALRHVVRADAIVSAPPSRLRRRWIGALVAAAVLLALIGGYRIGELNAAAAAQRPPTPTVIVPANSGWQ
jgi:hypothetical protein